MGKTNFDQLMKRYLTGDVSEEEKIKIETWLEVMKSEGSDDLELSKEAEEKLFQKITSSKDNIREIEEFRPGKKSLTPTDWMLRIAAGLLILCVLSISVWYLIGSGTNTFQVASSNDVEKVILNDGTLVWLRGESKLSYVNKEDEGIRFTELNGEALFEVAKDADHPFVIQCGSITLKVLGTSFSVKTNQDSLELKVLTGKVNLSLNGVESIDVEPNEKVFYTGNGKLEKQSFDKGEAAKVIADTEYNMQFENVTLKQAIENLQKKFDVSIKLDNKQIGKCRITVDLTDRSLESSLQMITEVLDVQYQQDDHTITIHGSGCK